jgi:hypothetical protein
MNNYPNNPITSGATDPNVVSAIQSLLNERGSGPIVVDGLFGKKTLHAVKVFQSQHCDAHGHPLKVDGIVGQETWYSLYDLPLPVPHSDSPLLNEVLRLAVKEIGVREDPPGSNKGKRVEEYLRSVHVGPGSAWCEAFIFWLFHWASINLVVENPVVDTAGCMQHWKKTTGRRIFMKEALLDPSLLEPGDIFIISRGDGRGHTGLITGIHDGYIETIEGNTNDGHSAEGVKVCALRRKISSINLGFIKYS